jgi:hypothetical protein
MVETPEKVTVIDVPTDRTWGSLSARPSTEKGGLRSPSLFGGFSKQLSARGSGEIERQAKKGKKGWVNSVVGKMKGKNGM